MQNESAHDQLGNSVQSAIKQYFSNLDGMDPSNIYEMVLAEIEGPLLRSVMQYADNNQSKAAKWLGLSRNTLRKLLDKYNL